MTAIDKVVALAKSEVGYLEKASNKDLDSKTANAGFNNWTKYARDLDAAGFYNTKKNGYPWCDVFFDWLLYKCFGLEMLMKMTGQPKGAANSGAGCGDSMFFYRQIGQVFDNPKPGDQIFFWNSTRTAKAHTGLVVKVENGRVYTIEGNTSDSSGVVANGGCVCEKSYDLGYNRIAGYGRPKYALADGNQNDFPWLVIDISSWQKGIDLSRAKAEGVKAVILRGGDGKIVDSQFETFYQSAEKNGLPVGCYWFSRATTVEEARAEANRMITMAVGKNIQLPIYIDCECDAQRVLGKDRLTQIVLAFSDVVQKNGHIAGVYTTEEWLKNYMHLSKLDGIEKWIAKWSQNKPKLDCGMWQFGGETNYLRSPKIAGMTVDQNYLFKDYMEGNMKRFYKIADLKADENAKKYYLPTVEKLIAMGVGSKGGTGDDTIIDLGEDAVRLLCILDKLGKFDEIKQGADADTIIREIANILLKEK